MILMHPYIAGEGTTGMFNIPTSWNYRGNINDGINNMVY